MEHKARRMGVSHQAGGLGPIAILIGGQDHRLIGPNPIGELGHLFQAFGGGQIGIGARITGRDEVCRRPFRVHQKDLTTVDHAP